MEGKNRFFLKGELDNVRSANNLSHSVSESRENHNMCNVDEFYDLSCE